MHAYTCTCTCTSVHVHAYILGVLYLADNLTQHYSQEYPVGVYVTENILFSVDPTSIKLIEYLHEHERIEYHCEVLCRLSKIIIARKLGVVNIK